MRIEHEIITNLEEAMQRRLSILPSALRPFTREYHDLPQTLVLTGPRGVGKTTFLLHHATGKRFLYLSMDNPSLANFPLYDLVRAIFLEGYEGVIIDEVHLLQTGAFTSRRSAMTFHAIRYGRAIHPLSCCGMEWAISLVALSRFRCRFSLFENSLPSKQARTIQPATLSRQMFLCPWFLHQRFLRHFSATSKEALVHFMHSRDLKSEWWRSWINRSMLMCPFSCLVSPTAI